jgi:pimeloyl-ACP methyl ester carboxylesterase
MPGHVMKVSDSSQAHGAILGKAMSSLPEGKGVGSGAGEFTVNLNHKTTRMNTKGSHMKRGLSSSLAFFLLLLSIQRSLAHGTEIGTIISVSSPTFVGGQASMVTVRVQNRGDGHWMIIEYMSAPSGWSISPTDFQPYMSNGEIRDFSFAVTPPSTGGSGTIVWRFLADNTWPTPNTELHRWNQAVSATPAPRPAISLNRNTLNATVTQGQNPPNQTFEVWNSGGGTLVYSVSDDATWLSVVPIGGTSTGERDTIQVQYFTSSLQPDQYSARITVSDPNASNSPQYIYVTLFVNPPPPAISLNRNTLNATVTQGQNAPDQTFEVWNSGGGTLVYSVSDDATWLSVVPIGGTSTGERDTIQVQYFTSTLQPGQYSARITVSDPNASNSPQYIYVTLFVNPPPPLICLGLSTLIATVVQGQHAPPQAFEVWNCGGGTLVYSVSDDATWLSVMPTGGTSTGEHDLIQVQYSTSSLQPGQYSGRITVTDPNASNSPQYIYVTLVVEDADDQIAEAKSAGDMTRTIADANGGSIDQTTDVDMWFFHAVAGQRISVDIDIPSFWTGLNSYIRLFDSNGSELAFNNDGRGPGESSSSDSYLEYTIPSTGRYYVGVSAYPNTSYNPNNGSGDTPGNTTGAYDLVLSPGFAGRVYRDADQTTHAVYIHRYDSSIGGYPRAIDPQSRTWLIVHGWNSSAPEFANLAQAVTNQRPGEQVLLLDWSSAANTGIAYPCLASRGIEPVADWTFAALQFVPFAAMNLNFIGHSYGSYVCTETAGRIPGGVHTIVGLEPAAHFPPCAYDPNSHIIFSNVAEFSWAFHTSALGSEITPATAHESFVMPHDHIIPSVGEHSHATDIFVSMLRNPSGGVSQRFRLDRLLSHTPGPWCPDRYTSHAEPQGGTGQPGYEAIIEPTPDGTAPESITYIDCSNGREITIPEIPDSVAPTIGIDFPTSLPTYENNTGAISLAGSASDNVRVKRVDWRNDRGGGGTAAGTTSWVAGGIPLQEGVNVVTVTARDVAGNTSSDTITVTYQPVTLTVLSSNPDGGVPIIVSFIDNNGEASGTTPFTRRYDKTTVVSLTAPEIVGCNSLVRWERDGAALTEGLSTTVRMDSPHTLRAVFALQGPRVLTVDCRCPGDGSFCTFREGYDAACAGDTLHIFPCNYPDTGTFTKALRLEAPNGVVNIGIR